VPNVYRLLIVYRTIKLLNNLERAVPHYIDRLLFWYIQISVHMHGYDDVCLVARRIYVACDADFRLDEYRYDS
jgi:hypothetical protein